ncbi:ankyrin repeat domain-containing protein [Trujillonella endophytica]|uniref:Ankyrin repeat n=1 Tax=Trujillonella endophytica TaxID=673521 RepID=A0A1H8SYP5_9ACTN|nr:ankyrin repeat domain-containing protein [Trujillella endophytica]SEO84059.1 Ankyrin repeat [Trujillella endophytica]
MSDPDADLHAAAERGNVAAARDALRRGAQVDARSPGGRTALMTASMRSAVEVMRVLLDAGAAVDLQAALGETALITAASGRGRDSVLLLLEHGADPTIADVRDRTVLMWLVDIPFHRGGVPFQSVEPLVRAGARIDAQDVFGQTALMVAVQGDLSTAVRPAVLAELVANGADVDLPSPHGETAMFGLVRYVDDAIDLDNGRDCIQVLLDAGADPNVRNAEGRTPLGSIAPGSLAAPMLTELGFTA